MQRTAAEVLAPRIPGLDTDHCSNITPHTPVRVHEHSGLWQLLVMVDDVLQVHIRLFGLRCRGVLWLRSHPRQQLVLCPSRLLQAKGKVIPFNLHVRLLPALP